MAHILVNKSWTGFCHLIFSLPFEGFKSHAKWYNHIPRWVGAILGSKRYSKYHQGLGNLSLTFNIRTVQKPMLLKTSSFMAEFQRYNSGVLWEFQTFPLLHKEYFFKKIVIVLLGELNPIIAHTISFDKIVF